jgi:hypothetical protein
LTQINELMRWLLYVANSVSDPSNVICGAPPWLGGIITSAVKFASESAPRVLAFHHQNSDHAKQIREVLKSERMAVPSPARCNLQVVRRFRQVEILGESRLTLKKESSSI